MAIDARYQNNIVLKQDAFQNLLTNIKNYPIVDVDYITEADEDELHGEPIWSTYTSGTPCIKITYGDERSTKGNSIWNEDLRKQISDQKKRISELQTVINELNKRKNRWEEVYQQNYKVYIDKDNQVKRFKANFDQIEGNKISFLTAGWNLLFLSNALNIDDPYQVVPAGSIFDSHIIYYTHSNIYLFERYSYEDPNTHASIDVYESYDTCGSALRQAIEDDWAQKVANQEIYIKTNEQDIGPVLYQDLGPEMFSYSNILLTKNPYNLVYSGDNYDNTITYYVRNTSTNTFSLYNHNRVSSDDPLYDSTVADWTEKVAAHSIYTKDNEDDPVKTYNLQYTSLNALRGRLINELTLLKNSTNPSTGQSLWSEEQVTVFQNFIDFIRAYNKLVFLDTIGIAGYDAYDIQQLREYAINNATSAYTNLEVIINYLTNENDLVETDSQFNLTDFDWEKVQNKWSADLEGYYYTFRDNIQQIVTIINGTLNSNLTYIRNQIRNINYTLIEYNQDIINAQNTITRLQNKLNNVSAVTYIQVPSGSEYNDDYEYCVKVGEDEYEEYRYSQATWNNSTPKYIKQDRTTYGYKYIKVGDNVKFIHTYSRTEGNCRPLNEQDLEITDPVAKLDASTQESGTFRATINGHVYEVPIKGFTVVPSNKNLYLMTWHEHNASTNEDSFGNINFQGNLLGSGNIITNNGHIFASGGAVAAATYQALRGYYEGSGTNFNNSSSAGLWYDGTANRLIRTWDISHDNNTVGLGTYQLVLMDTTAANIGTSNETTESKTAFTARAGIINNGNTIEFHTGLPSTSYNTNNNMANIKVGNIDATGNIKPIANNSKDIGASTLRWNNIYGNTGDFINLTINGNSIATAPLNEVTNGGTTAQFWRGGNTNNGKPGWSNTLTGNMTINGSLTVSASNANGGGLILSDDGDIVDLNDGYCSMRFSNGVRIYSTRRGGSAVITLDSSGNITPIGKVYRAVFNDYAECRPTINLTPGHAVIDQDDGTLACTSQRLQPGAQIISDTYGDLMGKTEKCQTPIAVAGRVLVYTYQNRYNYHAGMAVCSAPNGTVDIMTREEIRDYPDCIVGIVSEIPEYEYWGTDNVKVNERIWIKVK